MVQGVLVTHGALGAELMRATEAILGPQTDLLAFSNREHSLEQLEQRLVALLGGGEDPLYLFVDLIGGSCSHACLAVARDHPRVRVFSGVNLPMLLEFCHHRGRVADAELRERIVDRGKSGVLDLSAARAAPR